MCTGRSFANARARARVFTHKCYTDLEHIQIVMQTSEMQRRRRTYFRHFHGILGDPLHADRCARATQLDICSVPTRDSRTTQAEGALFNMDSATNKAATEKRTGSFLTTMSGLVYFFLQTCVTRNSKRTLAPLFSTTSAHMHSH